MKRRDFITLLGGAAAAPLWPRPLLAQPKTIRRVGFLGGVAILAPQSDNYKAFLAQLDELGFRAGRNVFVEYKALADPRGPAGSAGDLLRSQPDVIVVTGPEIGLQAVVAQAKNVPVVFLSTQYDPVVQKHAVSFDKPGGNVTGVYISPAGVAAKQVELLTEALPGRRRFAVAWDNETAEQFAGIERAAKEAKLDLQPIRHERPPYTIELTFKNFQVRKSQMAMFLPSPHFGGRRSKIAELATARKLPTMFASKAYVEFGRAAVARHRLPSGAAQACRHHGQNPARREAGCSAGRSGGQARSGGQYQNGQGDRRRAAGSGREARRQGRRPLKLPSRP